MHHASPRRDPITSLRPHVSRRKVHTVISAAYRTLNQSLMADLNARSQVSSNIN
jgi:hypothetical protein